MIFCILAVSEVVREPGENPYLIQLRIWDRRPGRKGNEELVRCCHEPTGDFP